MPKFTSEDVSRLAERLKFARDNTKRPSHFLIGAGCSIAAGIPSAKDLINKIRSAVPAAWAGLPEEERGSYGACMDLLGPPERRDFIRQYLEDPKINWGTLALAQLIEKKFVGRVLTVNFDLVLENACGLLGLQPAVYDFGVAPAASTDMIVSPAIIHLHGQSYGLVLLNTEEETEKHRIMLEPTLTATLRMAPLIVAGYSGSADGIFHTLLKEFKGDYPLYWLGYEEEMPAHIQPFKGRSRFQFMGGADFDRFMIELAQKLECWPPHLFADPSGHLLNGLKQVVDYPVKNSDGSIDVLVALRRKLESWQTQSEGEQKTTTLRELYMKGDYAGATALFASLSDKASIAEEDRTMAYWSFVEWGNQLFDQARSARGDEAGRLFEEAAVKYERATEIRDKHHEALNNWGNVLFEQARRGRGDEARLLDQAGEKYAAALAISSDFHEALNGEGNVLFEQAKLVSGELASGLLGKAAKKYAAALAIKSDFSNALNGEGNVLFEQAKRTSGEEASRLFALAADKYKTAWETKPDSHDALSNWGNVLTEQGLLASGEEAARLFATANEKFAAALAIKPDSDDALNTWGSLLFEQAKRAGDDKAAPLFAAASDKYRAALAIRPEKYEALNNLGNLYFEQGKRASATDGPGLFALAAGQYAAAQAARPAKYEAYYNWGSLLAEQARRADGAARFALFGQAAAKLEEAAKIDPSKTYNLACLAALSSDEERCRMHLENAEKHKSLPSLAHLMTDKDLDSVRDKPWFKQFLARQQGS
jgi:Tfp pilus assembly protein PilF